MRRRVPLMVAGHGILVAAGLLLWQYGAARGWIDAAFFGRPSDIFRFLYTGLVARGDLWPQVGHTLMATLLAFVGGSLAAIVVGLIFANVPWLESLADPYLTLLNAIPRIALAPIFMLWFGIGLSSKVAVGISLTFFIVLSSTIAGIRSVNPDFIALSRALGGRSHQLFFKVTLPSAVPIIFSGLRLGLIYAMLGVVGSELIAAERGLGQLIASLQSAFDVSGVLAVLLLLAFLGLLVTWSMSSIEQRLLRWR